MSKAPRSPRPARKNQKIESLEQRLAMSADPIADLASGGLLGGAVSHHSFQEDEPAQVVQHSPAEDAPALIPHDAIDSLPPLGHHGAMGNHVEATPDFWLDDVGSQIDTLDASLGEIEQTLQSAHGRTGLNDVRNNYGFRGGGQTVAVIDSGIAYDHYALGGGFGSNYRVVGGWDFTGENDANPYDDGPEGSHGTHVAGIIGSSDSTHEGVAPDVDLVGLRVFDDNGAGYFSWVENALDWVIANRNAFENPITAVNLSLGTSWNSSSIPSWAMLEDEFAALEAAGIFISVSAGNSFTTYNTPGLSYPAASPYVVPVMSMDDSGVLSYFSQRHQTAIAAPGRWIYSTIPDYAGNNNGVTDDWANFSGTSMAAPYVAGASVIIREAMEFVGMTGIDQDTIYAHMLATADTITDAATGLDYARLNLGAAIDALMPTDDYGSSEATAYNLGTVTDVSSASMNMNGVISTLDDGDYFTFTAGINGEVTFAVGNTTHDLAAAWTGMGGNGWTNAGGQSYTMEVVAGQQYTIALSSSDGLGYYDLTVSAESTFSFTDWGMVSGQLSQTGLTAGDAAWYRVVAGQDGYLTAQSSYASGTVNLDLYNANLGLVASGASDRVDYQTTAGTELYLRVEGSAAEVAITLTNLVSASGSTVSVAGTAGDDAFTFTGGTTSHEVSVAGVSYTFAASTFDTFTIDGAGGTDSLVLTGTSANETHTLRVGSATLASDALNVTATNIENLDFRSGGGGDYAYVFDSTGDDTYDTYSDRVEMAGAGYNSIARGMERTFGYASGGDDTVNSFDSAGDDIYNAYDNRVSMVGSGFNNYAQDFESTLGFSSAGSDKAFLFDTAGDDLYRTYSDRVVMTGDGFYSYAQGFANTYGYASTGEDSVYSYDSAGDDLYRSWEDRVVMSGAGYSNYSDGFDRTFAYGSTGEDVSYSYDSSGDDVLRAYANRSVLTGDNFYNYVQDFTRIYTYSTSGYDQAYLYDSAGDDLFRAYEDRAVMSGAGYYNYAQDFDRFYGIATTGNDQAFLYDSVGDDVFQAWSTHAVLQGADSYAYVQGFARTVAITSDGNDVARFNESSGDDTLTLDGTDAAFAGADFDYEARDFDSVTAYGDETGNDVVDDDQSYDFAFSEVGSWA